MSEEYRSLMIAVLRQAVTDAKGRSYVGPKARKRHGQEATRWLAYEGPAWFKTLDIGLPLPAFRNWLDERAAYWESYEA